MLKLRTSADQDTFEIKRQITDWKKIFTTYIYLTKGSYTK